MSEWKVVKLGEVTNKITDGSHFSPKSLENGFPIATVENMKNGYIEISRCRLITREDFDKLVSNSCSPEIGDVLLSKDGTIGKTLVYKQLDRIVLLSSIAIIKTVNNLLFPYYLKFFFESDLFYHNLNRLRSGSAIKRIVLKDIKDIEIPLAPLPEQQKIADILSSIDEAISKTEAIIEQTETVKKGLMQDLLTKGIGHTKFKQTEIGEIPEEWELVTLDTVSSITRLAGAEYSDIWETTEDGVITALKGFNIGENELNLNDVEKISEELSNRLIRSKLFKGDIVFPCVGTIGNAAVIREDSKFHINQNIAKITPSEKVHSDYLVFVLMSNLVKNQIIKYNTSSSQPNVLVGSLRKFLVTLPPIEEQLTILNSLQRIYSKKKREQQKLSQLQTLKKGLMQDLLTGKVRVKLDN